MATGLSGFDVVPSLVLELPPALLTHTSRIDNFTCFQEASNVAVVGAGQSALEAAALLLEVGATPVAISRKKSCSGRRGCDRNARYFAGFDPLSRGLARDPRPGR